MIKMLILSIYMMNRLIVHPEYYFINVYDQKTDTCKASLGEK